MYSPKYHPVLNRLLKANIKTWKIYERLASDWIVDNHIGNPYLYIYAKTLGLISLTIHSQNGTFLYFFSKRTIFYLNNDSIVMASEDISSSLQFFRQCCRCVDGARGSNLPLHLLHSSLDALKSLKRHSICPDMGGVTWWTLYLIRDKRHGLSFINTS